MTRDLSQFLPGLEYTKDDRLDVSVESQCHKYFKRLYSIDCQYFVVLALFRYPLPSSASPEGAADAGGAVEVGRGRRAINKHLLFILLEVGCASGRE